jgi:hypothetical protein
MGGMGRKATREIFQNIADIPAARNIILVATCDFIGKGFDEPRLDTLYLAMPRKERDFNCKSVRQKNAHASNDETPESGIGKECPCINCYPS